MSIDRPQFTDNELLFIRVSAERQATGIGQAALIAIDCIKNGKDPMDVFNSLDKHSIENILKAAKGIHPDLSFKQVERVVEFDFALASQLIGLGAEVLDQIANRIYTDYIKNCMFSRKSPAREEYYWDKVKELIGESKAKEITSALPVFDD